MTDPRLTDHILHPDYGREGGIHRDDPDGLPFFLVLVGGDIALTPVHFKFSPERKIGGDGTNLLFGIHDLHVRATIDVTSGHLARSGLFHQDGARFRSVELQPHLFQVQDDLGNIFMHTINGGKFMQGVVQANGCNGGAADGGEHDPPQRIANGRRKSTFQWLANELAIPVGKRPLVDLQLLRRDQRVPVFVEGIVIPDFLCHAIPTVKVTWSTARRSAVPG